MSLKYKITIISLFFSLLIFFNNTYATSQNDEYTSPFYICPMHHHIHSNHASHCPICGMALILDKKNGKTILSVKLSNPIKEAINVLSENVRTLDIQKEIYTGIRLDHIEKPVTKLDIELLQPNLKWIHAGNLVEAEANDSLWGEHTWLGRVTSIEQTANPQTHRYTAHIELKTPYSILKPNMYITLTFYGENQHALVITFKSVIFDQDGKTRVIKVIGKNQYQTIPIKIGIRQDHLVQVLEGLEEHDKVVTSGQFFIDTEKQLKATGDL